MPLVNGHWDGHYQHDVGTVLTPATGKAISAHFRVDGERLTGDMTDHETALRVRFQEIFDEYESLYSAVDRRQASEMLSMWPDLMYEVILPSQADLTGTVRGTEISFWKEYRGDHIHQYVRGDDRDIVISIPHHRVFYWGIFVSADKISGRFRIPADASQHVEASTGTFEMVRRPEPSARLPRQEAV